MSIRTWLGSKLWRAGDIVALGYDGAESNRIRRDLGWGRNVARDEEGMAGNDRTREILRLRGIDLRRNHGPVAGVCDRLALWTVGHGVKPHCATRDHDWNNAAQDWWHNVYSPTCDSRKIGNSQIGRSSLWDFQTQIVANRPTMGGLYFQMLEDGTIRPIEPERIRNPKDTRLADKYTDGVQVDRATGRIVSYRVHARDSKGGFGLADGVIGDVDVSADSVIRAIRPLYRPDQVREIPDLAPVLPLLQDIKEMSEYVLNTAKVQSKVIGAIKKLNGLGGMSMPRGQTVSPVVGNRQTVNSDWGMWMEMFPGEDWQPATSAQPNIQHIPYVKYQYALCAAAMGFPYEFFTLDLSTLDFSRQKGMLLMVNNAIKPWKRWIKDYFLRPLWNWRVAMECEAGRALDGCPVDEMGRSEWDKVEWEFPEEPWIDREESMQSDMLEVAAGQLTWSQAAKRRGSDLEKNLRRKAADLNLRDQIAKETGRNPDELLPSVMPANSAVPNPEASEDESPVGAPVKEK